MESGVYVLLGAALAGLTQILLTLISNRVAEKKSDNEHRRSINEAALRIASNHFRESAASIKSSDLTDMQKAELILNMDSLDKSFYRFKKLIDE